MRKGWILILFGVFGVAVSSKCQEQSVPQETLDDLAVRIRAELNNFQDYVSFIGEGTAPEEHRRKAIENCILLFAPKATIQEKNKYSQKERNWEIDQYLWAIFSRGEKVPVIIEYEVIDQLNAGDLEEIMQPDGSVIYRGTMVFRQKYCRLKPIEERVEMTEKDPNINCAYSDTTEKEVTVEIKRRTSIKGEFWITQFTSIKVLRVY